MMEFPQCPLYFRALVLGHKVERAELSPEVNADVELNSSVGTLSPKYTNQNFSFLSFLFFSSAIIHLQRRSFVEIS